MRRDITVRLPAAMLQMEDGTETALSETVLSTMSAD